MNQTKIVRVAVRITEAVIDIIKDEFMNDKPKKKKRGRAKKQNENQNKKDKKGTDISGRNSTGSDSDSNL